MPHYIAENPRHLMTRVFLDGVEVEGVTECNTDEGWLVRIKRDENGNLMATGPKMDQIATERLEGVVTAIEGVGY